MKVSFVFRIPQRRIAELTLSKLSAAVILSHLVLCTACNNATENYLQSILLRSASNNDMINLFCICILHLNVALYVT